MKFHYLAIIVLATLSFACVPKSEKGISIYPDKVISNNFIGNGVQWSAYPHADTDNGEWGRLMTDEKWALNFERLDYMQPKLFRILDQANWRYLVGFNENNQPIIDFNTPEIKALERILDYAQANNITVLFGEWGTPFKVHDTEEGHGDKFTGANDSKWINIIVEYLDYLINTRGYTCLKYYNLVNEPNGDWATTKGDFNEWADGVKLLDAAIKAKGLDKHISVAGPDAVTRYDNPNSTYSGLGWMEETYKQLGEMVGIYEIHDYTTHELVKSGNFKHFHKQAADIAIAAGKQIIFGEIGLTKSGNRNQQRVEADPYASKDSQMEVYDFSYGIYMADAAIQAMNAGFSGSAAWALDDAMHTLDDKGDKNQLKRWGMWNSLGTELCNNPDDEEMRPWFYTWSLMCRYFPVGSSIINTDTTGIEGLRLTAGIYSDDISVAIVNNSDYNQAITLALPNTNAYQKYLYVSGESKVDDNNFPVAIEHQLKAKELQKLEMPANSFVLLTTIEH